MLAAWASQASRKTVKTLTDQAKGFTWGALLASLLGCCIAVEICF